MSRRCDLIAGKGVMVGNNVSHSNRKTKRRFLPNLHVYTYVSPVMGRKFKLKICRTACRTIDKYGGFELFLLNFKNRKLTETGQKLKRKLIKAMSKKGIESL